MEPVGILLLYYICKIMINIIITMIGVIKELSPLYFYNKIKDTYYENNIIFGIMVLIMAFLLYPYMIMMGIISLPSLLKRNKE